MAAVALAPLSFASGSDGAGRAARLATKHAVGTLLAALALVVLAPLLVVLALAVRLSSPGPVLFCQQRVGRDGRPFTLLKFRSMRMDERPGDLVLAAGSAPGGVEGSDRRTRVGRLMRRMSLDELPQLLNVLRGDMSLVGPRPERPKFVERFSGEVDGYEQRHRMRVGMTGLAQVRGLRGQTSIARRAQADLEYIDSWTLRGDLLILARTVGAVVALRGE